MPQCAVGCINEDLGGLLASYEFNLLDNSEKDKFENHMSECAACADEINGMRETWAVMKRHVALFENPRSYYEKRTLFATAWRFKPVAAMAAAAMLFLAFGVGYFHQPALWRAAGTISIEEDAGARFRKGSDALLAGMEAWRAKDLETAKRKLQAVEANDAGYYQAQYVLGLCHLKEADTGWLWTRKVHRAALGEAQAAFLRAATAAGDRDPLYQAQARLGLAKVYLLGQEREKAVEELAKVETMPGPEPIGALKQTAHALKSKLQQSSTH